MASSTQFDCSIAALQIFPDDGVICANSFWQALFVVSHLQNVIFGYSISCALGDRKTERGADIVVRLQGKLEMSAWLRGCVAEVFGALLLSNISDVQVWISQLTRAYVSLIPRPQVLCLT